jgi:hypothetical protein
MTEIRAEKNLSISLPLKHRVGVVQLAIFIQFAVNICIVFTLWERFIDGMWKAESPIPLVIACHIGGSLW